MNSTPNHPKSLAFANHFPNHAIDDHDYENDRAGEVNNIISNGDGLHQQEEVMFEKKLTPSDVGKLNRLVIPKQHAERHFPLNTSNGADSGGMMLSFEDEAGKLWRLRYSYWNSSQSYVLTKGWSRFVKEKRLDTGDVVIFKRHPTDPDRLFILSRRTYEAACSSAVGCQERYPAHHQPFPAHHYRSDTDAGVNRIGSFNGSSSSRTLRLFGVDMEYQLESD